ncbi:unnamed protein product [Cyclocybe aegerita]|uniref:Fungal-type protein kinase domain-containing protein n=1 Tax=Cyclocybe aegerita TaxID=1973307 RepID=A0A8S0WRP6_CYCAE|nr:unnamed protein product [Cyclocybe aegerita]
MLPSKTNQHQRSTPSVDTSFTLSLDLSTFPINFMDTYRLAASAIGMKKELHAADVPDSRTSKVTAGCDDAGQHHELQPHICTRATWRYGPPVSLEPRAYHRFLQGVVDIHLSKFSNPRQLIMAIADTFDAHRQLLVLCGILHRNVNDNNVMLDETGRGILNDWDMAKGSRASEGAVFPQDDLALNSYRTGMWYFLSARLLKNPLKIHSVQDDLESFFFLVLYYSIRYIPNDQGIQELKELHAELFEECRWRSAIGQYVGGQGKFFMITEGYHSLSVDFMDHKPLQKWLRSALRCIARFYWYCIDVERKHFEEHKDEALPVPRVLVPPLPATILLHNHEYFSSLFKTALEAPGWASTRTYLGDELDQYVRTRGSRRMSTAVPPRICGPPKRRFC